MSNSNFDEIFGGNGFNPDEVPNSDSFEPIPPGWYPVVVLAAEVVDTKARDGKRVKIELEVVGEQFSGRKIFTGFNIVNPNPKASEIGLRELAQFSKACGLVVVRDTSEFIDKSLLVKVAIRADAGREPENETKGFKPINGTPQAAPVAQASRPNPVASLPRPAIQKAPVAGGVAPATKGIVGAAKGAFPWDRKPAQPPPAEAPSDVATDDDDLPF